ncbi:MAG: hypothetical protein J6T99_07665 [Oscillospiraceae bacterium]|nr:hypothetical protein [Oscillospiraceae bacterium]
MQYKNIFSLLLALIMLFSVAIIGPAAAFAEEAALAEIIPAAEEVSDVDAQLALIFAKIGILKQPNTALSWYYTVTDLDHNGRLEFIAASQHPNDRSTNLKIWEVNADRTAIRECTVVKDPDESFPDILTDITDTFYDPDTDTWFYLFYDNVVLSANDVYTSKSAYHLKNGSISYESFAVEHTLVENGYRSVSHTDANGISISPDQYNAAGVNAFYGAERSSTNFDWFISDELESLSRLADSFAVFMGEKEPTEVFPVPQPEALKTPASTPVPVYTAAPTAAPITPVQPTPEPQPTYLSITKNPTNENRTEGDTAWFVANANAYESLTWTMVSPNGGEYSLQNFGYMFADAPISGMYSTTLSIGNVALDMQGWGAYCTFYYRGQTARTTTAYIYVSKKQPPKPAPTTTFYGTVTDWSYSTVNVDIYGVGVVSIPRGICDVYGDLSYGAKASVAWDGSKITYCYIEGDKPYVGPVYGSMSGTAYRNSDSVLCVFLQNGDTIYLPSYSKSGYTCNISGYVGYAGGGASCVIYYVNYPKAENVYELDVYGDSYTDPYYDYTGGIYFTY